MKWRRGHRSDDVIDRRGPAGSTRAARGAGGASVLRLLLPVVKSKLGLGGVIALVVGFAVFQALGGGGASSEPGARVAEAGRGEATGAAATAPPDDAKAFVGFVLDDVQDTFSLLMGEDYRRAKLVLYTGRTTTEGCGLGEAATGPFYCPADRRVYIDLGFFEQLSKRLGAPGDFARAYVIAHEIGHHVQNLTGLSGRVAQLSKAERLGADGASVRLELMADCLAGVWAHGTRRRDLLEVGDIEESLRAAASIGDDTLQKGATGVVRPETFSHGTSRQRVTWFSKGLESGRIEDCNTFVGHSP